MVSNLDPTNTRPGPLFYISLGKIAQLHNISENMKNSVSDPDPVRRAGFFYHIKRIRKDMWNRIQQKLYVKLLLSVIIMGPCFRQSSLKNYCQQLETQCWSSVQLFFSILEMIWIRIFLQLDPKHGRVRTRKKNHLKLQSCSAL